ncbi:glutathione S-transferase family protein [Minwuia sp.]|uniref:glutathione S-transferase family protein n=1 Tax=Minwuia sp. TaxID=2493630 RepID=UPI003A931009
MAEYQLHCFGESGNAYKAALMLALSGADWEPLFVDFFNGAHKKPEYLAINEMAEVPVLVHGDRTFAQSGVMLDYLAETTGRFGPRDDDERREILRWMLFDNHKFTSFTATYRFMSTFVKEPDPGVVAFAKGRMLGAMQIVDNRLKDRDFLLGERLTIADLSLLGYMYYTDEFGMTGWPDHPNIRAWTERVAAMDGWQHPYDMMPRK